MTEQQSDIPMLDLRIADLRQQISQMIDPDIHLQPGQPLAPGVEVIEPNEMRPHGEECIEFAFHLKKGDPRDKSEILTLMRETYARVEKLEDAQEGDIIEYQNRGKFTHVAVYEGNGVAISKFGAWGPLSKHKIEMVPLDSVPKMSVARGSWD